MCAELKESLSEESERKRGKKDEQRGAERRTETLTKRETRWCPDWTPHLWLCPQKNTSLKQQANKSRAVKITADRAVFSLCAFAVSIFSTKEINARLEGVRWATICRRALMCSLQPSLKSSTPSSSNKGNKIRAKRKTRERGRKRPVFVFGTAPLVFLADLPPSALVPPAPLPLSSFLLPSFLFLASERAGLEDANDQAGKIWFLFHVYLWFLQLRARDLAQG